MGAFIVTYLIAVAVTGGWLWAVAKWSGLRFPLPDLAIIVGLCSGLSLLPGYGWLLGMVFLWLLVSRVEQADLWPETILMAGGSALVWLVLSMVRLSELMG